MDEMMTKALDKIEMTDVAALEIANHLGSKT